MGNFCILDHMKMRKLLIPVAAVLITSLMPHIAQAASQHGHNHSIKAKKPKATAAPKVKQYSVTMAKAHLPSAPNKGTDDYYLIQRSMKIQLFAVLNSSHSAKTMFTTQLSFA
jgi:hypothetical protein